MVIFFFLFVDWKEILSKTSVMAGDQMFKDNCKACFSMNQKNRPAILGTSLTSLEPEPSLKLYMARGKSYLENKLTCKISLHLPYIFCSFISRENLSFYGSLALLSEPCFVFKMLGRRLSINVSCLCPLHFHSKILPNEKTIVLATC